MPGVLQLETDWLLACPPHTVWISTCVHPNPGAFKVPSEILLARSVGYLTEKSPPHKHRSIPQHRTDNWGGSRLTVRSSENTLGLRQR